MVAFCIRSDIRFHRDWVAAGRPMMIIPMLAMHCMFTYRAGLWKLVLTTPDGFVYLPYGKPNIGYPIQYKEVIWLHFVYLKMSV